MPSPRSLFFPYTTLFRSYGRRAASLAASRALEHGSAEQADRSLLGQQRAARVHAVAGGPRTRRSADAVRLADRRVRGPPATARSEEHTSELQSHSDLVCRLLALYSFPTRRSSDLTGVEQRRWQRAARLNMDLQNKLIDRFSANNELLAYMQSPVGRGLADLQTPSGSQIGESAAHRRLQDRKSTRLNSSHTVTSYAVSSLSILSLHDALPILRA